MRVIDDNIAVKTTAGWGDGWRPIWDAPKDQDIMVWGANLGILVVQYDSECGGSQAREYPWQTLDGPNYHKDAFTYWQPLPAPPRPNL